MVDGKSGGTESIGPGFHRGDDAGRPDHILAFTPPRETPVERAPVPSPPIGNAVAEDEGRSPWSGSAWLFTRPEGHGPGLAAGGQLGGSQLGTRIVYRASDVGPGWVAIAARVSMPIRGRHAAEAAVGIDWRPVKRLPLRLSVERRVAIGHEARNAWSAYAAGGFWHGGRHGGMEADGYAQAGMVGARRRDLFADGAVRLGMPIALGEDGKLLLGGGAWGAAQPGASRLDLGPRLGLSLSIRDRFISGSLDWRFRVAGDARPGSGPAITLAADF